MMQRWLRKKSGFSLLEIILALVLLTLVATGVMGSWTWAQRGTKLQEDGQAVELYLDKKMAELKLDYAKTKKLPEALDIKDFTGNVSNPNLAIVKTSAEGGETGLQRVQLIFTWDVKAVNDNSLTASKKRELVSYFFRE